MAQGASTCVISKQGAPSLRIMRFSLTGSAIKNWYKVKTWLDLMFWQIYQKLMLSGFLRCGNLCLIHYLKLFWRHTASTSSNRKGARIQHQFSWFCQKNIFSKHQNKVTLVLKIIEFKNLEDSEVHSSDFSGLRNLSSLIDLSSLSNLTGLNSL